MTKKYKGNNLANAYRIRNGNVEIDKGKLNDLLDK